MSQGRPIAILFLAAAILRLPATASPQVAYAPPAENLRARAWFQDAKFGLFVHWGVYCLLGDGEWVMNNDKIPVAEYEKLPAEFNPIGLRRRGVGRRSPRPRA